MMVALAFTLALGAQAPAAAPAAAPDLTAAKALTALFNDPTTPAATFQAALDTFVTQFPTSKLMLPALVLGVRYYRSRNDYGPLLHFGLEALKAAPGDLYTLSSLATAIPNNVKDTDLDRDQMLDMAAGFDRQIISTVNGWLITTAGLDWGGRHYTEIQGNTLRANLAGPAYLSLGRIASLQQHYPAAVEALRQALAYEHAPTAQAQVYFDIGVAEAAQAHKPEALAAFARAQKLAPGSEMLQRLIRTEQDRLSAGGAQ